MLQNTDNKTHDRAVRRQETRKQTHDTGCRHRTYDTVYKTHDIGQRTQETGDIA